MSRSKITESTLSPNFVDLDQTDLTNPSNVRKKFWKTMAKILLEKTVESD